MSKITPRKFTLEDMKDPPEWVGPFLSNLNQFIQEVNQASINQLTVADNLYQEIRELKFVNDATNFPIKFKTKWNKQPIGLHVVYCQASDGTTASNTPWLTWNFADQLLTISALTNLTASLTYTIRILIIYG